MRFFEALKKFFLTDKPKPAIMATSSEGEHTMTKETAKNYTEAQEARLAEFDVITSEVAEMLAQELGKDVRSIRAKAVRLGTYQGKVRVSKSGTAIERKEAILEDISKLVGQNMQGLEKASKHALIAIRKALSE